jgi:hypothetical protein
MGWVKPIKKERKGKSGFGWAPSAVIMSDDMHEILNASGELSATVAQIKKAL